MSDVAVEPRARRAILGTRARRRVGLGVLGIVLLVAIWQATVSAYGLSAVVLPSPWSVLRELGDLVGTGAFWHDLGVSLLEFGCGYVVGVVLGTALGLAMAESPALRMTVHPVVESLRFVVPFAWIPLVVLWFGTSLLGKVVLVAYAVFFVMVVSTLAAVRRVDPTLTRAATMLGMGRRERVLRVHLRAAAPSVASACRASAALGWIAVVAAEYVGSSAGIGFLIINAQTSLQTDVVIAGMVVIGVVGAGLSAVIAWISRRRLSYA